MFENAYSDFDAPRRKAAACRHVVGGGWSVCVLMTHVGNNLAPTSMTITCSTPLKMCMAGKSVCEKHFVLLQFIFSVCL